MKKAKNAFAIIGIVLAVVAAALLMLHPVIDAIASKLTEGAPEAMKFSDYKELILNFDHGKIREVFRFEWIKDFSMDALKIYYPIVVGAVGLILFIVLFIVMLCKKHAKGLGWFFPMLILFVLSVVVAGIYVIPSDLYEGYALICSLFGYFNGAINEYLFLGSLIASLVAAGSFIIAIIFYMIYVCQERKKAKKADGIRKAAIEKIESLLGGNN